MADSLTPEEPRAPYGDHSKCPLCSPSDGSSDEANNESNAESAAKSVDDEPEDIPKVHVLTETEAEWLEQWEENPEINPKSGRKLVIGAGTHVKLSKEFRALRESADPAKFDEIRQDIKRKAEELVLRDKERAERVKEHIASTCQAISSYCVANDATRSQWLKTMKVHENSFICRSCEGDVACSVTRTECLSCSGCVPIDDERLTRCRCHNSWTLSCESCHWEHVKTFTSFFTSRDELKKLISRGPKFCSKPN